MRFPTGLCIALILGLPACSNSQMAYGAEIPLAQAMEEKTFIDLAQKEPEKVAIAANYFRDNKTSAAKVVPRVLPLLKIGANAYKDNAVLFYFVQLLEHFGPAAKAAIPQLIEIAVKADRDWTRARIGNALAEIGPDDERVVTALRMILRAPREPSDVVASAQRATQTLLEILDRGFLMRDPQNFLSRSAQTAVSKAALEDAAGVPALANALKSPKQTMRMTAAKALANIGAVSAPAAANLSAALRAEEGVTDSCARFEEWPQYMRLAKVIGKDEGGLVDTILEILDSPRVLNKNGHGDEHSRANLWIALADILSQSGEQIKVAKRRAIAARVLPLLQSGTRDERFGGLIFIGAL